MINIDNYPFQNTSFNIKQNVCNYSSKILSKIVYNNFATKKTDNTRKKNVFEKNAHILIQSKCQKLLRFEC